MRQGWRPCLLGLVGVWACGDENTEQVTKDVCYSEQRWVGGTRGSPEMFPGRDCVGCHTDNDGPPLAIGGTVYPYVISNRERYQELQSGSDCFGLEGVTVVVTDSVGQVFELTTNRAGNFYVEGSPDDFAKPFQVRLQLEPGVDGDRMGFRPFYGGCANCHDPSKPTLAELAERDELPDLEDSDPGYVNATARIGVRDYRPNGPGTPTVEEELEQLVLGR